MIQVRLETPATDHVMKSAQEAAGLQLMNDRWWVLGQPSALPLAVNPDMMLPVIRGLTDVIKRFVIQLQDHLR